MEVLNSMAVTPEGKIKKQLRKLLDEFTEQMNVTYNGTTFSVPTLKQFWPVPSGFGKSDLDCIVCYGGQYIAIETKAPGKKPTPRQDLQIAETIGADGYVFVIDGDQGLLRLRHVLEHIRENHVRNR
jgi:hypothetical protein